MKKSIFIALFVFVSAFSFAQELYTQQQTERLFKTGLLLIDRKEFGAAQATFRDFIATAQRADLRLVEAEYYQAYCALNLYQTDGEKLVEDFVSSHPNHPRAGSVYFDLANFFYAEKNYSRAIDYFKKVNFSALSDGQVNTGRFKWGYSLFSLKKLTEALEQFNFIKSQGGQYGPASSYYAGFVEYGAGNYENAFSDLKRAQENESYASIVPYLLVCVYYKQQKYDELLRFVSSLKQRENLSNADDIALLVAEANYKKFDFKTAYEEYKKFFGAKPSLDRGLLARAGFSALSIGQDDDAISYFKSSASDRDSVGFFSSYYLGVLYIKKKQKPLAFNAFDIARKFKLDKLIAEEALYQYSKVAFDLSRGDNALDGFENYLKLYPEGSHTSEVKELLSQAYVTTNNYDKAIDYIESLDKHGPALDRAYQKACFLKATELFNKESYDQAQLYFKKSLTIPVEIGYKAESLFWLGETYSINKEYTKASEQYRAIFELDSYSNIDVLMHARYSLGYAYFNLQQYDKALFNFKEYTTKKSAQDANLTDAVLRLADCYYVTKSYSEALSLYKKIFNTASPDVDYAYLQAGNIFAIQGNYKESAAVLDIVIKNYKSSRFIDEALFQRAQIDFEQGNYAQAVVGFTKLIESGRPSKFLPYAFSRRASSNFNLKDFDKTASDYIAVLDQFPLHPVASEVLLPLQEALSNLGRSSDFDKYLAKAKEANPSATGIESIEFESAKSAYFNQDYSKAIVSLGNFVGSYPNSPKTGEANYYRAESYYRLKEFGKALDAYYQMTALADFSYSNKVMARIAELEFKNGNYQKAMPAYWKLNKMASTKKEAFNAWSGLMESHYALAHFDSVEYYAHQILERGKVNAGAENKASLYLGKAALGKGDNENAKDEFLNTLNNAQDEYGAEAKYLLAELQFKNKEHKQCYETLVSLNRDFSSYAFWVGKSYLLLADNFVAMGDKFNAKASLKSLLENSPVNSIKDQAKEKLKRLEEEEINKVQDSTINKKN